MSNGKFVISLDFELYWGVRDKKTIDQYGENIRGVHQVIPRLLEVFNQYHIKATFSAVGFLFFKNKQELLTHLPDKKPAYLNQKLSPYIGNFTEVGEDPEKDPYRFAPQLIHLIQQYPEQEIGSHTFSHYYCLEQGQTIEDFKADIQAAQKVADNYSLHLTSLVFPRNQFNDQYLNVIKEMGIIAYRGNEHSWLYKAKRGEEERLFRRALRLVDAYLNISGPNCYTDEFLRSRFPVDIPSSRFLRPYSKKLAPLDVLRLQRIKSGMTYAAKKNKTYHLWWHPHNFGINQDANFNFLNQILDHYKKLNAKYKFESYTMSALVNKIHPQKNHS